MKREDGLNDGLDEKRGMKIPTRKDRAKSNAKPSSKNRKTRGKTEVQC